MYRLMYGEGSDTSERSPVNDEPALETLSEVLPRKARSRITELFQQWQRDLDNRDDYSGAHAELAAHHALTLAKRLQLSPDLLGGLWVAGHVYDLGKIALPPNLLRKEGPLSNAELLTLRSHVSVGYDLLRDWDVLRNAPRWLHDLVLEAVLFHHERWDGGGYLKGKHGDEIPLHARIVAIADAFTAMILNSPYRHARSPMLALQEIASMAGEQFDPYLVQQFVSAIRLERLYAEEGMPGKNGDAAVA